MRNKQLERLRSASCGSYVRGLTGLIEAEQRRTRHQLHADVRAPLFATTQTTARQLIAYASVSAWVQRQSLREEKSD